MAMSSHREKTLRKLAEMMNTRHRTPFPISQPLLECFEAGISDEEADFLVRMGTDPIRYEKAAEMSGREANDFAAFWNVLLKKGLVWPAPGDENLYVLPGIMLGWFEMFLSNGGETPEQVEFSRRLDKLFRSWGKMNVFPMRNILNHMVQKSEPHQHIAAIRSTESQPVRKIPVNQNVPIHPVEIVPTKTVDELIEKYGDDGSIAVVHCFCRQYHKMVGEPCRFEHPAQSCIAIGRLSHFAVQHGSGRMISKAEAKELIRELQQKGAVHQVFHEKERLDQPEIAICNCCWDCCGVLGSYSRGIIPLKFQSYFEARLQDSLCELCNVCIEFCPTGALVLEDEKLSLDGKKCIGCGQCELHCPAQAIRLESNERAVILPLVKPSHARISL